MPRTFQGVSFEEALPRLVVTYNQGKLVPFTGSGISAPSIPTWRDFLENLCSFTNHEFPKKKIFTSQELIQFSEEIVTSLSRESKPLFIQSVKESLGYKVEKPLITAQCRRLSDIWWPLVLSTNYDTMFIDALKEKPGFDESQVAVFGRNAVDCHSLLASLNAPSKTAYWALQGFFGANQKELQLEDEIVVGYRQYRNATYNNLTFRSVFAEVFRNNSLLFLGTGLSEDYFKGLFGEVLEKFGSNPHTHCALFNKKDIDSVDHRFLHTKLNITAVFYEDREVPYDGLLYSINALANALKNKNNKLEKLSFGTNNLTTSSRNDIITGLEIVDGKMPAPVENQCYVFNAGYRDGVLLSMKGASFIDKHYGMEYDKNNFVILEDKLVTQYKDTSFYAAFARNAATEKDTNDFMDLKKVSLAVEDTLQETNGRYDVINVKLLTAGKTKEFSPVFSLIQMIRGYKIFIRDNHLKSTLRIHVDDPSAVFYFRTNPLEIEELLNCDDIRVNIEIQEEGDIERHQLYVVVEKTLAEVSYFYSIKSEFWEVQIIPAPANAHAIRTSSSLTLENLGLIPGSTIIYKRKKVAE